MATGRNDPLSRHERACLPCRDERQTWHSTPRVGSTGKRDSRAALVVTSKLTVPEALVGPLGNSDVARQTLTENTLDEVLAMRLLSVWFGGRLDPQWVCGYNTNQTPPTVWSDKVAAINATLSEGVKPIMVVPAGAF